MSQNPVIIPLKFGEVYFQDIIKLEDGQLRKITSESIKKTQEQWLDKDTPGVKIDLSQDQKKAVLAFKNEVVEGMSAEELITNDIIEVIPHSKKRINYRLEGQDSDKPLTQETLVRLAQAIIDCTEVKNAQWKGRPNLTYTLVSSYNNKLIEISLLFTDAVVIITVTTPKNGPAKKDPGFTIRDLIQSKKQSKSSLYRK